MVRIFKRYILNSDYILPYSFFFGLDARLCPTHTNTLPCCCHVRTNSTKLIIKNVYDSNTTLVYTRKIYVIRVNFVSSQTQQKMDFQMHTLSTTVIDKKLQPVGGRTGTSKIQSQHHIRTLASCYFLQFHTCGSQL